MVARADLNRLILVAAHPGRIMARGRPDEGQGAGYDDWLDTGVASLVKGASCSTLNFDALNLLKREFLDKMLITTLIRFLTRPQPACCPFEPNEHWWRATLSSAQ
jgi:hypothetical protein